MPFEILVGVQVKDADMYAKYRAAMTPILERMGGAFRYDWDVARVLKSAGEAPMNRVFTLRFPDKAVRTAFFADTGYKRAKVEFFEKAVAATTIIAEYDVP
jgi:uncharacterized protein (DUF1330 family)